MTDLMRAPNPTEEAIAAFPEIREAIACLPPNVSRQEDEPARRAIRGYPYEELYTRATPIAIRKARAINALYPGSNVVESAPTLETAEWVAIPESEIFAALGRFGELLDQPSVSLRLPESPAALIVLARGFIVDSLVTRAMIRHNTGKMPEGPFPIASFVAPVALAAAVVGFPGVTRAAVAGDFRRHRQNPDEALTMLEQRQARHDARYPSARRQTQTM